MVDDLPDLPPTCYWGEEAHLGGVPTRAVYCKETDIEVSHGHSDYRLAAEQAWALVGGKDKWEAKERDHMAMELLREHRGDHNATYIEAQATTGCGVESVEGPRGWEAACYEAGHLPPGKRSLVAIRDDPADAIIAALGCAGDTGKDIKST